MNCGGVHEFSASEYLIGSRDAVARLSVGFADVPVLQGTYPIFSAAYCQVAYLGADRRLHSMYGHPRDAFISPSNFIIM
jgi:hypothetical protein